MVPFICVKKTINTLRNTDRLQFISPFIFVVVTTIGSPQLHLGIRHILGWLETVVFFIVQGKKKKIFVKNKKKHKNTDSLNLLANDQTKPQNFKPSPNLS